MKDKLNQEDHERILSGIGEMEATIEQYRKEINALMKKRDVLLKINRMLNEELKDSIRIFSL